MVCVFCRHNKTNVVNSRQHTTTPQVWRRRSCPQCKGVFTTYETISEQTLPIVESSPAQPFHSTILLISIHNELPDTPRRAEDAANLTHTIVQKLLLGRQNRLSPQYIAQTTYEVLRAYDKASGIRYGLNHKIIDTKGL